MSNRRRLQLFSGPKGPKENEIWYTTTDGQPITPSGFTIISNTYSGGIGKIVTSGKITSVPNSAWLNKTTLSSVQYRWENILTIGSYAFGNTPNLTTEIVVPNCTSIGQNAFYEGSKKEGSGITGIDAPLCTSVANYAFRKCNQLVTAILPSVITTGQSFIESGIQKIYFRDIETIGSYCFQDCSRLETMVIDNITPPALQGYALNRTPSTMRIYVPDSAVDTYKAASGWSSYASRIHPLSELPE